jgi:hypothetical protein
MKTGKKIQIGLFALLLLFIIAPVTGETGQPNSAIPVWSDEIGKYSTLVDSSGDGTSVIAGSDTGIVRMYNSGGKILWTYNNPEKSVTSVSIAGKGEYAAVAFYRPYDGEIIYFNMTGTKIWELPMISEQQNHVALSEDGSITTASNDTILNRINSSGTIISTTMMPSDICRIASSDDGTISTIALNSHCPWRGVLGSMSGVDSNGSVFFNYPVNLSFSDIGISGNGKMIVGIDENKLYVFGENGSLSWNYTSNPRFRSVAVSSDGQYVSAGSQYFVRFFNKTGAHLWDYYDDKGWVNAVSVSGEGRFIIAGSSNKILLFDKTGAVLWQYTASSDVVSVSSSRDGYYFAAGTKDKVYFFNRWGNTTIIDRSTSPGITSNSSTSHTTSTNQPMTKSAPVSSGLIIFAVSCIVIIGIKGRQEK